MARGAETMDRKAFLARLAGAASLTLASCQGHSGQQPIARSQARLDKLGQLKRPLAIAMWDFSWILRHHRLGEFADWDGVLDGLVLRGYNAVRIDCMPQFVASGPDGRTTEEFYCRKTTWKPTLWGNDFSTRIRAREALLEFLPLCRQRGVRVGLASWFLDHGSGRQDLFGEPDGLARAWTETLEFLDGNSLLDDSILYVDVLNEYPFWHGYRWLTRELERRADVEQFRKENPDAHVPNVEDVGQAGRFNRLQKQFYNASLAKLIRGLKQRWPRLDYLASLDSGMPLRGIDLADFDALDYHVWFTHNEDLRQKTDYGRIHALAADAEFGQVYAGMRQYWQDNRSTLVQWMDERMGAIAAAAEEQGIPCGNTEGWGPIMWMDHPELDWRWVKESGDVCVGLALDHGYRFICTSNFTHPQFPGLWNDLAWHQRLTGMIRGG